MAMLPVIRIIAIGDGMVGKTCLFVRYAQDTFDSEHNATVCTKTNVTQCFEGKEYQIQLIDTAGQEGLTYISTQHYSEADVFIICYSIDTRNSFKNVTRQVTLNISSLL